MRDRRLPLVLFFSVCGLASGAAAQDVPVLRVTLDDDSPGCEERFMAALRTTPLADAPVRPVQPSLEDVFIARLSGAPSSPPRGGAGRENLNA